MNHEEIIARIAEIEREIAILPAGGVSKKNVHGNIYYYHRITQNGKRTEKYCAITTPAPVDNPIKNPTNMLIIDVDCPTAAKACELTKFPTT